MLCYKDKTFCNSDCTMTDCFRFFGAEQQKGAEEWWGSNTPPIAFANFSASCDSYKAPNDKDTVDSES